MLFPEGYSGGFLSQNIHCSLLRQAHVRVSSRKYGESVQMLPELAILARTNTHRHRFDCQVFWTLG